MPKIPSFNRSPSLSPRTGTQSFTQGATAEGEAVARFGEQFSRVVGGVADKIDDANNKVNLAELKVEARKQINTLKQDLATFTEGEEDDGSDILPKAQAGMEAIRKDVLGRARSGSVKQALDIALQDRAVGLESSAMQIAKSRQLKFLESKNSKVINDYASVLLTDPEQYEEIAAEYSEFNRNQISITNKDLANKLQKSANEEFRRAIVAGYESDEDSLEELESIVKGSSNKQGLNSLFNDMTPSRRQAQLNSIDRQIKARNSRKRSESRLRQADMEARILEGEPVSPDEIASEARFLQGLRGVNQASVAREIDGLKAMAGAQTLLNDSRYNDLESLVELSNNPDKMVSQQKFNAHGRRQARKFFKNFVDAKISRMIQDPGEFINNQSMEDRSRYEAASIKEAIIADEETFNQSAQLFKEHRTRAKSRLKAYGLTPNGANVLPNREAKYFANLIATQDPAQVSATVGRLNALFGEDARSAFSRIREAAGEESEQFVAAALSAASLSESARAQVYDNINNRTLANDTQFVQNHKDISNKDLTNLYKEINSEMEEYDGFYSGTTAGENELYGLKSAVKLQAKKLMSRGMASDEAAEQAVKTIVGSSFRPIKAGNSNLSVPQSVFSAGLKEKDLEQFVEASTDFKNISKLKLDVDSEFARNLRENKIIRTGFLRLEREKSASAGGSFGGQESLVKPEELTDSDIKELWDKTVAKYSRYIKSPGGDGLMLVVDYGDGVVRGVSRKNRPVSYEYDQIKQGIKGDFGLTPESDELDFWEEGVQWITETFRGDNGES